MRLLGHGGMAKVELARDTELDRPVAIKRLAENLAANDGYQQRFLREARLAARLSHPNIVAVYDAGAEGGVPFIVMEYVEGETVSDLLRRRGRLEPAETVALALQACSGLETAHEAGLVHRDIKPQNLLIASDGTLKIADFGIARSLDGTQLTQEGTVLGTIDLGGVPERGVGDGKGMLYVVMQDAVGSVTVVDVKTMKATGHYSFVDKGGCNGLALDVKNQVLFAACRQSGNPPAQPTQPMMVILSATDGKILTSLPLAGGSDGAVFNPSTMEAFSTHGNGTLTVIKEKSPTSFEVEQNLETMNGARTITFDSKTNRILTMSQERGPAPPPPPPGGGRGAQGTPVPGSFTILMIASPWRISFIGAIWPRTSTVAPLGGAPTRFRARSMWPATRPRSSPPMFAVRFTDRFML